MDILENIKKRKNAKEPLMKQSALLCEAITEVIRMKKFINEKNNTYIPSAVDYFGAVINSINEDHPEIIPTSSYVLSIILPHISKAVILAQVDTITNTFSNILISYSENIITCRHILECILIVLDKVGGTYSNEMWYMKLFKAALVYSVDSRSKVRRTVVQHLYHLIYQQYYSELGITRNIAEMFQSFSCRELAQCNKSEHMIALYLCGLWNQILPYFPNVIASNILEPLLKLTSTSKNSILTTQTLNVISSLFKVYAEDKSFQINDKNIKDRNELVIKLFNVLSQLQPHINDELSNKVFTNTITMGMQALYNNNERYRIVIFLPQYIKILGDMLLSNKEIVVKNSIYSIKTIIQTCIDDNILSQVDAFEKIIKTLENLCSYKYKSVWSEVFNIYTTLFYKMKSNNFELSISLLKALDTIYQNNPEAEHVISLFNAIGAAITSFGPDNIMHILPLKLTLDDTPLSDILDRSRVWLLPLFQQHIKNTKLSIFFNHLLPIMQELWTRYKNAEENNRGVERQATHTLIVQIWETFPSFCNLPLDMSHALRLNVGNTNVIDILLLLLKDNEFNILHKYICKGFINLIETNQLILTNNQNNNNNNDNNNQNINELYKVIISNDECQMNLKLLGDISKQFLPLLLNMISSNNENDSSQIDLLLKTCEAFASVSSGKRMKKVMHHLLERLIPMTTSDDLNNATSLCDLCVALCPYVSNDTITLIYDTISPLIHHDNAIIQKKGYKILARLCEKHNDWLQHNFQNIFSYLLENSDSCQNSAIRNRLKCLKELLLYLPNLINHMNIFEILAKIISEIVFALKESSQRTREVAFDVLLSIGHSLQEANYNIDSNQLPITELAKQSPYPLLCEYICMISGGLALPHPHSKSATILAISSLVYTFRDYISDLIIKELLDTIIQLLRNQKSREVVRAVLGYIKVASLSIEMNILEAYLPSLVEGLCNWSNEHKDRFRQKIKAILQILLRKFGYNVLKELIPSNYNKLLDYIKKQKQREDRQKTENWKNPQKNELKDKKLSLTNKLDDFKTIIYDDNDDNDNDNDNDDNDNDDNDNDNNNMKRMKRKHKSNNIRQENQMLVTQDADLLDNKLMSKKLQVNNTTTKGKRNKSKPDELTFDADGKLVVATKDDNKMNIDGDDMINSDSDDDFDIKKNNTKEVVQKKRKRIADNKNLFNKKKKKGNTNQTSFVPMHGSMLNRRTKHKSAREFENLISAAKKASKNVHNSQKKKRRRRK